MPLSAMKLNVSACTGSTGSNSVAMTSPDRAQRTENGEDMGHLPEGRHCNRTGLLMPADAGRTALQIREIIAKTPNPSVSCKFFTIAHVLCDAVFVART